ncbi:group 3 secretory phospholipase A2-like isoform X2 [Oryzias latipes]|uniref:phospholipase A2 n=1 Tax=Oryzias latipes TaxID=8090 RepID=A0A3B3HPW0_ORYLA|nr:group 3 secretory phospholipase A2-like isoform X2 [Oryzias latipes]
MLAPPSSSSIFNNLQFHSDSSSAAASILRCAMTRAAALLSLILASSLLHARASILCTWTKVSPNDEVHYAFLQSDLRSTPPALRLHHSAWSARRALLACAWSDDAAVVQSFLSRCRQRPRDFSDHPNRLLHSLLEGVECASLEALRSGGLAERRQRRHPRSVRGDDGGSEVSAHLRVKRGFIVPGTLWCGSGNKAPSFEDLGVFSDTDSCCREHDQCQHTILSFQSEFGVFNSNIFTMSHCDCDDRFHGCLKEANDSISDVVGYTFFNLLKMHCFTFSHRLQCAKRNWFGMCKETQMALYADVHPPTLYETTPPEDCLNITCSNISSTVPAEQKVSTLAPQTHLSTTTATATFPTSSRDFPSITSPPKPMSPLSKGAAGKPTGSGHGTNDLGNALPVKLPTVVQQHANVTEKQTDCGIYRELDECKMKILPQQVKYGLINTKAGTLYHCNCTARLFQTLAQQRSLAEVEILLLSYVSQSCFLFQDCTPANTCPAVEVKATLQKGDSEEGLQRHLQALQLKVRRPKTSRAARKDRPVRLFKLCIRKTRPRQARKGKRAGQKMQPPE